MPNKPLREYTPTELLRQQNKGGALKGAATKEVTRRTNEFSDQADKHRANNPERYQGIHDPEFFNSGVVSRSGGSADEAVRINSMSRCRC